jgi:hypothetical protein
MEVYGSQKILSTREAVCGNDRGSHVQLGNPAGGSFSFSIWTSGGT